MPGPRKHPPRILEPIYIEERQRWRVVGIGPNGRRSAREHFPNESGTEEERAWAHFRKATAKLARLGETTVQQAIERYRQKKLIPKGNKPGPIEDTVYRLETLFRVVIDARLASLTDNGCDVIYHGEYEGEKLVRHGLRNRPTTRRRRGVEAQPCILPCRCEGDGPPLAADSHRNMLAEAKTFMRWCVTEGIIDRSPLEAVKGEGKRRHGGLGHARLRPKEQRAWFRKALELAGRGTAEQQERALGALMSLGMAMRATEIVTRRVRDLDDEQWVLGVYLDAPRAASPNADGFEPKTRASEREFEVPKILRPFFVRAAKGKKPDAYLLGGDEPHWRDWVRKSVQMICGLAKVPLETAHGMRGAHASIARAAGATAELVARQLGHDGTDTGERSYTSKRASRRGAQAAALQVLKGGRR